MAEQTHSSALTDGMSSHIIPTRIAGNSADWHYPSTYLSSHGRVGSNRSKRRCPCGTCHQPGDLQSKRQCTHGIQEKPISISSSESDWSTSPQRLSAKATSNDDSSGMTLKIRDSYDAHHSSEYWLQRPTQDEALRGCGSWQDDGQSSEMMPSMSSVKANIQKPL